MAPKLIDPQESTATAKAHKGTSNQSTGDSSSSRIESANTPNNAAASEVDKDNVSSIKSPSRSSWYNGAWRTKSSPVTATAKESISVEQGVTSEASEKQRQKQNVEMPKRPGHNVSRSMRGSRKSIPLAAEPTRVHATSESSSQSRPRNDSQEKLRAMDGMQESQSTTDEVALVTTPQHTITDDIKSIASTIKPQATAWLGGFWSRPDGYPDSEKMRDSTKRRKLDDSSSVPMPPTPQRELDEPILDPAVANQSTQEPEHTASTDITHSKAGTSRSWFGMWSNAQNQQQEVVKGEVKMEEGVNDNEATSTLPAKSVEDLQVLPTSDQRPTSAGWAFWSHERQKDVATTPNGTQKQLGEIAVADTPSQSHPEAVQFNEQRQRAKLDAAKAGTAALSSKRTRPVKATETEGVAAVAAAEQTTVKVDYKPSGEEVISKDQRGKGRRHVPNTVSPLFSGMYPAASNAGYVEKLAKYLAQTLSIPGSGSTESQKHVLHKSGTLLKIKKAIAIGVHGFFPAPLLQRVLGPPTGTSIRFANYAATSIAAWCKTNQPDVKEIEIEKVALEGEGLIADRVNTLWKLLLNWLDHLRQADFVMVACHSQGVPVAIMLVAKLIQLGVLSSYAKIGICAMAGINLGPFMEYRSRLFAGSALELFDFCDSGSKVSKSYFESVDVCLRYGVRITYVGSLDDQLVSLESSLFAPLSHPYVHRATFIDGRLHSPSFLTHLVIFALKLRNLGISDHGLLRELSAPLAGSLVGGEGHSRIYDDPTVYRLAIDFALESTDVDPVLYNAQPGSSSDKERAKEAAFNRRSSISGFPASTAAANSMRRGSMSVMGVLPGIGAVIAQYEPLVSGANSNPFYLPWAVRGMLEENIVKQDMRDEAKQLVEEFDAWRPQSKVLKDVRWRLEGVKSML